MDNRQSQELRKLIAEIEGQKILFDFDNWLKFQQLCVEWGDKVAPFLGVDERKIFNRELDGLRVVIHKPILPSDFSGTPKDNAFRTMKSLAIQRLHELELAETSKSSSSTIPQTGITYTTSEEQTPKSICTRIWHDPVWSKVIAALLIAIFGIVWDWVHQWSTIETIINFISSKQAIQSNAVFENKNSTDQTTNSGHIINSMSKKKSEKTVSTRESTTNSEQPIIREIVTPNEEEKYGLPGTTTSFFNGDLRVAIVSISLKSDSTLKIDAKLAGDDGIKAISGGVGDVFEFGHFKEYRVAVSALHSNYAVFNIKCRELTSQEQFKKQYPGQ